MTPKEYTDALALLDLTHTAFAEWIGFHRRTSARYGRGDLPVPLWLDRYIRFLLLYRVKPTVKLRARLEQVEIVPLPPPPPKPKRKRRLHQPKGGLPRVKIAP